MEILLLAITLLAIAFAPILLLFPRAVFAPTVTGFVIFVMMASVALLTSYDQPILLSLPHFAHTPLLVADFLLLGLFFFIGYKKQSVLVWILALTQVMMLGILSFEIKPVASVDIKLDQLSLLLIMLVSIVGGIITIYSTTYMKHEKSVQRKRQQFSAILVAFMGVMNLLAVAENLELFFFAFELTTLASFVLIGWRGDKEASQNATTALWMNQIGGIAILIAIFGLALSHLDITFSGANASSMTAVLAFLSIAALIKGAQMPFDRWLLGAMVAPTPVSAILHSSTMVKIAPFMILKISPAIAGSYLATALIFFGGFVFVIAGVLALGKRVFKEILAYSTISLLGLMIMLASIATPLSITAAVTLMVFHGVAKAMLFMEAGVLEKQHHAKTIDQMASMLSSAPMSVFIVLLGFASVALPPFGALVGKWVALEASITASFSFVFIALGSVVITLLYFKVVGYMLAKSGEDMGLTIEKREFGFKWTNYPLAIMLALSALFIAPLVVHAFAPVAHYLVGESRLALDGFGLIMPAGALPFWQIASLFVLIVLVPVAGLKHLKGVDRVTEYSGGERLQMDSISFYFDPSGRQKKLINTIGVLFFLLIIICGVAL